MAEGKPYVAAAFLCEKVLEDKDKVLSAIRIVDTYLIPPHRDVPPDFQPVMSCTVLVALKRSESDSTNKHEVVLRVHTPSGRPLKIKDQTLADPTWTVVFEPTPEGQASANVIVNLTMPVGEFGAYWFDVIVDGESLTRIPFRLLEQSTVAPRTMN